MAEAQKDGNYVNSLIAVSSVDGITPVKLYADPTTHRLLVDTAGGYTNLTQFVDQTPWRLFYSNGSGDVTELGIGAAGTYLFSNGASAIPSWSTPSGSGDVSKVGTPVNNQIGVWTGDGTLEGTTSFTFDSATDILTMSVEAGEATITGADAISANTAGAALTLSGGNGLGTGNGGGFFLVGGTGGLTADGGDATLKGGEGGATSGNGGTTRVSGGDSATSGNGGSVIITPGLKAGAGTDGIVSIANPTSGISANLLTSSLTTSDKSFTFPDISGTFALLAQDANFNTLTVNTNLLPDANDGAALGAAATAFSDLFLATGALIGFGNGNAVITHSSGILTVSTGDLRVTTAGSNTASVVTVGGTQTLTNKTLTSPAITTATLSGAQVLAEGASIQLDPSLSADGTYSGITITGTAGTTLAFGDLIYLSSVDSRWELVDADSVTTCGAVLTGMCVLAAAADGDATTILLQGNIRADAAFPALTVGANVYAGLTAGDIVTTAPSATDDVVHVVGKALTADSIYFNPSQDYITIV